MPEELLDEPIAEFSDPRLVAIYDTVNAYEPNTQPRFYRDLAAELRARSIIDVGCGTGLITCDLAQQGHHLIGLDPAPAMIEAARQRPGGEQVRWIVGDISKLGELNADLAIMSGHVAQFFLTDASWGRALRSMHDALRPGGYLAFETRNPDAREWERWTPDARSNFTDPVVGQIETWVEFGDLQSEVVTCVDHYVIGKTGEELTSAVKLGFRSEAKLRQSVVAAGFEVERLYRDWKRQPITPTSPELILVARRY
jgi:SAM-dependent methyltransferase